MKKTVFACALLAILFALLTSNAEEIAFQLETPTISEGPAETWFELSLFDRDKAVFDCEGEITLTVLNSDPFTLMVENNSYIGQLTPTDNGQGYYRQVRAECGKKIGIKQEFFLTVMYKADDNFVLKEYDLFVAGLIEAIGYMLTIVMVLLTLILIAIAIKK